MRYPIAAPAPPPRSRRESPRQTAAALASAFADASGQRYSHLFEDERVRGFSLTPEALATRRRNVRRFVFLYAGFVASALGFALLTSLLAA